MVVPNCSNKNCIKPFDSHLDDQGQSGNAINKKFKIILELVQKSKLLVQTFTNRPFTCSWFDFEIIHVYVIYIGVISLTTNKMVSSLATSIERTTN
jgi:hypothetical protein